jgi:hypothetical protein
VWHRQHFVGFMFIFISNLGMGCILYFVDLYKIMLVLVALLSSINFNNRLTILSHVLAR